MLHTPTFIGVVALALAATGAASAARAADAAPLCIYEGNSFSEGAHICAQASLMMTCSIAGERAVWKVVTDNEISRLCTRPSRSDTGPSIRSRRHAARRFSSRDVAPRVDLPPTSPSKCFTFNGKRYCE